MKLKTSTTHQKRQPETMPLLALVIVAQRISLAALLQEVK